MKNRYDDEVEYWRGVLSALKDGSASNAQQERCKNQLDTEYEIAPELAAVLPMPSEENVLRVLDVGCGPLTVLGKRSGSIRLAVTGVDPLADQYRSMLGEIGITPPFELRRGFGEEVNRYFEHNYFDFVYSRNALDHSQNPKAAIRAMLQVARPGTVVWVNVNRNEAINASYSGLHSWNFDELHDTLVLWNPGESVLFEQIVEGLPFRWKVSQVNAEKKCPQEIDILIFKEGINLSEMAEVSPGVFASITGQQEFLTIWLPSDADERFNFFIHGYDHDGKIVINQSYRWYNSLRRRSIYLGNIAKISHFLIGQFDVHFSDGRPVYKNLWTGKLSVV